LKKSFCDDIRCFAPSLRPIVVHGGGPEITRRWKSSRQGESSTDSESPTPSDLKVVGWLTGSINTELVTLLNATASPRAVASRERAAA